MTREVPSFAVDFDDKSLYPRPGALTTITTGSVGLVSSSVLWVEGSGLNSGAVSGFWLRTGDHSHLSAKGNNRRQQCYEGKSELATDGGVVEGKPSRQLAVALPGPLAVGSLAQDAREAGGTMAALMVVAGATVLTAQQRVVTHMS